MPRSKPKSRLQQLREQVVKMGGEDIAPKFETLQLHAGYVPFAARRFAMQLLVQRRGVQGTSKKTVTSY